MDACALQNTRLHCTAVRCSAGWFGQAAIQKRAAVQEWLAIVEDWSSLRVAAACRLPRIAKFLLRRGADPDDLTASSPPLAALKAAAQPSPWPSSMVVEGTTSIGGRGYGASPAAFFGAHAASSEATKGLNNNTNDGGGGGSGGGGGAVGGSGGYKGGGGSVWVPVVCQQTLRLMRVASRGWSSQAHWYYTLEIREVVHTILLIGERLDRVYMEWFKASAAAAAGGSGGAGGGVGGGGGGAGGGGGGAGDGAAVAEGAALDRADTVTVGSAGSVVSRAEAAAEALVTSPLWLPTELWQSGVLRFITRADWQPQSGEGAGDIDGEEVVAEKDDDDDDEESAGVGGGEGGGGCNVLLD